MLSKIKLSVAAIFNGNLKVKKRMEKWIPMMRIHVPKYTDMDLRF
jgi:hypothetical protein